MIQLEEFFQFLAIPTISTDPSYAEEVKKGAEWVKNKLSKLGFKTEVWQTKKHPIIFAESPHINNAPTLLIYNHYDVQPVDPLELWENPPFSPILKNGQIYARGAQDNKGQCFYVLEALRYFVEKEKGFPINIKLCIEGEEECGSKSLSSILPSKTKELEADYVVIVDLGIPSITSPAITLGTRGLITMDLEVVSSKTDLHSGMHGGLAYNPIHALIKLLSDVRAPDGRITIPHFYDGIEELTKEELSTLDFTFDEKKYEDDFGMKATGGEINYPPKLRNWLRPTLEVNGINGGYTGDGFKTVIPAKAFAKISCRLVPGQDPKKVSHLLKTYFESKAPLGTKVTLTPQEGGGPAGRSNPSSIGVKAFQKAYQEVFKKPCSFILEGASIPIIPELAKTSGAEPILVGLGLPTDLIHAPNEHFSVDRLEMGAKMMIEAIKNLKKD